MLYERRHSRLIEAFGGIAKVVPLLAAVLTIVSLSSIGLPATNGFVGEFLVLLGTRSEEHTSELQSLAYLVCRLLLEKKKKKTPHMHHDIHPIQPRPTLMDSRPSTHMTCTQRTPSLLRQDAKSLSTMWGHIFTTRHHTETD